MADDAANPREFAPNSGRRLTLPPGPIFALQRAGEADFELGAFRSWAGYKDLGVEAATDGLALLQHVISFGPTEVSGRTGVHCHLAQVHLVIPTSGLGVFSYDGVVTEAAPGAVIVQHGGTVHDQFSYSYAPAAREETKRTPVSLEPPPADAPAQSFGFLELFIPARIANVEIVPPAAVTPEVQATAWDHPYHAPGASYAIQAADDSSAAFHPVAGQPGLEVRDAHTTAPTDGLVKTWIIRPRSGESGERQERSLAVEDGDGLDLLYVASGSATFETPDGEAFDMAAGDCLTCTAGLAGPPLAPSPDMRLLMFRIAARAETLHERSPDEIARLEALGPVIITRHAVRPPHDDRPVNFLRDEDVAPI